MGRDLMNFSIYIITFFYEFYYFFEVKKNYLDGFFYL